MHVCENRPLTTANLAWKVNIDTIDIQFHNPLHGFLISSLQQRILKKLQHKGTRHNGITDAGVCYSGVSEVYI